MKWKGTSNLIIAIILTLAYCMVTFLNIIGPLHTNDMGTINKLGPLAVYSIIYFIIALMVTWGIYFLLRKKHEILFFVLIIVGIIFIIAENFLWGWMGS